MSYIAIHDPVCGFQILAMPSYRHFADQIYKLIFLNENMFCILIPNSPNKFFGI